MDTRVVPSRFPQECCVCGTGGQNYGFTLLSDILPSDECNITQTITSALGVYISPSKDSVICEHCHLRIFNFKTFALECNRRREFTRQLTRDDDGEADGVQNSQNVQRAHPVFEKSTDTTKNYPAHGGSRQSDTHSLSNVSSKEISGLLPTSDIRRSQQDQCYQQVNRAIPIPNAVTTLTPFNLPTGTVMLKKETSSVYILPDGTTVEFLDHSSSSRKATNQSVQKQPIPIPIATTSQNIPVKNKPCPNTDPSTEAPSNSKLKLSGNTQTRVPYKKPTVILTDAVPVPTLLLPRTYLTKAATPPPLPPQPVRTNSSGKVAIPRILHCVKPRLPPLILPKVGADVSHLHCPMCNIFFIKKADMKTHLLTHPGAKMCTACDRAFPSKAEMVPHMRESHPELVCPVANCNFSAPNIQTLNYHSATHTEIRRHQVSRSSSETKILK